MSKFVSDQQLLGEKGVALVSRAIFDMGFVWRANTALDAGIDGHIELRDPQTGAVKNQIIQVQVKATEAPLNERDAHFDFRVDHRDMEYWLRGNLPVVLAIAIPSRAEVYWLSIREHAYDQRGHLRGVLRISKAADRLTIHSRDKLARLVLSAAPGYYGPPPKIEETLSSNLFPVTNVPEWLYVAPTEHRARPSVFKSLQESGLLYGPEWLLTNGVIISAHDLSEPPYNSVCDTGAIDPIRSSEWAGSEDEAKRREFVQLLNCCLRAKLKSVLRYQHERPLECLYFLPVPGSLSRSYRYRSSKLEASREVVMVKRRSDRSIQYVRHNAFKWHFVEFDSQWYLELTPTYLFTSDGSRPLRYYEDLLKGIKRLERNSAVLGQLHMWSELLTGQADMLDADYPFLKFGPPLHFDVDFGVNETDWQLRYSVDSGESSAPHTFALL